MIAQTHLDAAPTLTLDAVLAHGDVRWVAAGAEVVVHVPALAVAHVLDPAGAVLWQCLDGVSPLRELFADIADVFDVRADRVAADCTSVLQSWLESAIVTVVSAEAAHAVPEAGTPVERTWRRLVDPPDT